MPIDKNGIIYVEKEVEKPTENKKKKANIKDICLIITTCISLFSLVVMINQNRLQKLDYKNHIEQLELEKTKYENMLKESEIQLRDSYVLCKSDAVENLCLGHEDYNVKIYSNEIMDLFYDKHANNYYENSDNLILGDGLEAGYSCASVEIIFLRIDIVSNRLVDDLTVQCSKIVSENNIDAYLNNFSLFLSDENVKRESSESVSINVGNVFPSDMILIPLAVEYELYDRSAGYISNTMTYKIVYVPKSISYYDEFNNQTVTFRVRDMFSDAFMSEYHYYGLG